MSRWWPGSSLEFNNCYLQLVGVTRPARGYKVVNSQGFENNKLRQGDTLWRGRNPFIIRVTSQEAHSGLYTGESIQLDLNSFNFAT